MFSPLPLTSVGFFFSFLQLRSFLGEEREGDEYRRVSRPGLEMEEIAGCVIVLCCLFSGYDFTFVRVPGVDFFFQLEKEKKRKKIGAGT